MDRKFTKINQKHKAIVRFAKSKGFLSPLWLLPNATANRVKKAFSDLESFLHQAYIEGEILDISLEDIQDFMWRLKKEFAFDGWEGIAPYLLAGQKRVKDFVSKFIPKF